MYGGELHLLLVADKPRSGSQLLKDVSAAAGGDFKLLEYQWAIWPLLVANPKQIRAESEWLPPGSRDAHGRIFLLGTYDLGRDVLSGIFFGLQKALWIGLLSMAFAALGGLTVGPLLSYASKYRPAISAVAAALLFIMVVGVAYFIGLALYYPDYSAEMLLICAAWAIALCLAGYCLRNAAWQWPWFPDAWMLRYLEIMKSVPSLMVLLLLLQMVADVSLAGMSLMIGFLYMPVVVKHTRWQAKQMIEEQYIESAVGVGLTGMRIVRSHMWPKLIQNVTPVLAFGFGHAVLAESTLSFLGLGLPLDEISLGSMMHGARHYPQAWWAVLFPGLVVFWIVWTCNRFGDYLTGKHLFNEAALDSLNR